ncbi:MAG TPA: rhamnulose-1-phosphate aldolase [Candidatus Cloacimonadota bacterium]|nr:rhamnulose-1-phosphate aldolase [Candidatus Cloacimonadota bacterium]HQB41255.1 rhamnulose-1-phosphate aldolase [Candidatus Cloacimonadota bacterium]
MKFEDISEITLELYKLGWAERNAGNFSIQLSNAEFDNLVKNYKTFDEIDIDSTQWDTLHIKENLVILISVSDSRFRKIAKDPIHNTGILAVRCNRQKIFWYNNGQKPSSEWLSHLRTHNVLYEQKSPNKCILHTHPTELIALSHKLFDKTEAEINEILWDMMPEVKLFASKGIGLIPTYPIGSDELACATEEKIKDHDILLWKKHGCLSVGQSFWHSYEALEVLNKAAKIYLLAYQ